jgi:crotonobetainyl-CoA:carnitine CoA-transferase CaiB-like acyl-CoA transferase
VLMHNVVPRLSETPGSIHRAPPYLGEHVDEVLSSLGLDKTEIAELRSRGII